MGRQSPPAFHRRTGFYEAFPYGDASVGTPLRGDLQFVVLEKDL
jgi:hypothetical protein